MAVILLVALYFIPDKCSWHGMFGIIEVSPVNP